MGLTQIDESLVSCPSCKSKSITNHFNQSLSEPKSHTLFAFRQNSAGMVRESSCLNHLKCDACGVGFYMMVK